MPLSDSELWKRVKGLEGETIYTLKRRKANKILSVDAHWVVIERRATKPSREDIFSVYKYLRRAGEVTKEDLLGGASILKHPYGKKVGSIIKAILARVVPEEIEVIPETEGVTGIRLRKQ